MSIVRIRKRTQYVSIEHSVLSDLSLSWEAKGLHAYLLSRPDDWHVSVRHLAKCGKKAGRDKIYRMLNELLIHGYAERLLIRSETGRIASYEYIVHERRLPSLPAIGAASTAPLPEKPDTAEPDRAEPDRAEPDRANATLPNNEFNLLMNKPKSKCALTNSWLPSADALAILDAKNIPRDYSHSIIAEFILYWCEKNKYAGTWNSRFVSFVERHWYHEQTSRNDPDPAEKAFARFFDRSWANGIERDQSAVEALMNGKDESPACKQNLPSTKYQ